MVGPGASLGLPGAAARQKGSGSEEQLGEPHAAPPITTVCMQREGAHPHPHPWGATGGRRPPRALVSPGRAHPTRMTFLPSVRRPGACGTAFYLYLQWK